MENISYKIYGLIDPRDGELRYVGATEHSIVDRLNCHCYGQESTGITHKCYWIQEVLRETGRAPCIMILGEFGSRKDMYGNEKQLILLFRSLGFNLTNMSDGGQGGPLMLGKKQSTKTRETMSRSHKGVKLSLEHRTSLSLARRGTNNPMFGVVGNRHHRFGTQHTSETCRKISENHADFSGVSNPMYGKKRMVSLETRERLRIAAIASYKRRRECKESSLT